MSPTVRAVVNAERATEARSPTSRHVGRVMVGGDMGVVVNVGKRVDGRWHDAHVEPLDRQLDRAGLAIVARSADHDGSLQVVQTPIWLPEVGAYGTSGFRFRSISQLSYQRN